MIERDDLRGIAVLRIGHGKANALDVELCGAIVDAFDGARGARAIVVTGSGAIFSAGVDLFRILDGGSLYVEAFLPTMNRMFERVFLHPAPVVAAVNGHAVAGGCVLAAAADLRLMAAGSGRIGLPELRVGVPFPPTALEIMRAAIAPQFLRSVLYLAETQEPEAARELGLIDEIAAPDALIDRACARAERLASLPGDGFATTKRDLRRPVLDRIRARETEVGQEIAARWGERRTRDGIRAYLERTIPRNR